MLNSSITDTHTHLYAKEFAADIDAVIASAQASGVHRFILPAIDQASFHEMMQLAGRYKRVCFPAIGLHPTSVDGTVQQELDFVHQQIKKHEFVAIGEIGIDCYWSLDYIEQQRYAFEEQLKLSVTHNLPVIIHARESFTEIFAVLKKLSHLPLRGVFHSFTGTIDDYHQIKQLGNFVLGIGGILTFKNSGLADVVKQVDINDIILETDSPYLAPVPYRGKRNESAYIVRVAEKLAEIKNVSLDELLPRIEENVNKTFAL